MSACLAASFVGRLVQWGRTKFVLPHWASRPSPVATRPSGHKKGFLGPENLYTIYFVFDLDGECKFIKTKHYSIMFFLAATLVGWVGGDFVYRKFLALFWYVCILRLAISTRVLSLLIFGSVFSDCVVFYGDCWQHHALNNSVIPVTSWHVCLFWSPRRWQPPWCIGLFNW